MLDRQGQSRHPILAQIVVCAGLDDLRGRFVIQRAGDQQYWQLRVPLANQPDRGQPIDVRQIVIGNDQIRLECLQCMQERGTVIDCEGFEGDTRAGQDPLLEFGILWDIFEDQDTDDRAVACASTVMVGLGLAIHVFGWLRRPSPAVTPGHQSVTCCDGSAK